MKNCRILHTATSRRRISVRRRRVSTATRCALAVLSRIAVIAGGALTVVSTVQAQSSVVRLQIVNVPVDSGLLAELLPDF